MNSFGRLKILKEIDGGETQSYLVFDPERGREVLLHILPQKRTVENRAVWERLDKGLEAARKIVLDRGDLLGVQYVITEYIRNIDSLAHLLEQPAKESAPAPKPVAAAPGEFTRLFQGPAGLPSEASAKEVATGDGTTKSMGAGEFTRMFHPEHAVPPPAAPPLSTGAPDVPAAPLPAVQEPVPEPGEFTRLFQSSFASGPAEDRPSEPEPPRAPASLQKTKLVEPAATAKSTPPPAEKPLPQPAPSPAADAAEFARYFQNPLGKGSEEVDFNRKIPQPAEPPPKKPGEFTQMFGKPFASESPSRPVERREEIGSATGVFSSGNRNAGPPSGHAAEPSSGPGDYTKMFNAPAKPPAAGAAEPQPTAADAQPASSGPPIVLFAILGVLLVIAISLVLYFVLKR